MRPVSNLTDAYVIAAARKTQRIVLRGHATYLIPAATYPNTWVYVGENAFAPLDSWTVVDINGKNVDASGFVNLNVKGACPDADYATLWFDHCTINGVISDFNGIGCLVMGTFGLHNQDSMGIYLINSWFDNIGATVTTVADFTGATSCRNEFVHVSGAVKIKKLTDINSLINIHGVDLLLIIDATCTAGTINLYGDITLINNSGGATVKDYRTNQKDTRFFQETVAPTDVDGTTWKDLLDRSTITKPVRILGFKVTKGGVWAGSPKIRIVDGVGTTKIFPLLIEWVMGTDFTDATQKTFDFPVEVSALKGYKFQFRSSDGGDGAGETLTLDNLDVQELS
jgi:hypothetical protein